MTRAENIDLLAAFLFDQLRQNHPEWLRGKDLLDTVGEVKAWDFHASDCLVRAAQAFGAIRHAQARDFCAYEDCEEEPTNDGLCERHSKGG